MRIDHSTQVRRLVLACFAMITTVALAASDVRESDSGVYRVSYTSSIDPVEINAMHEWVLNIETAEGDPVEAAEITIDGGMPAHNHGLPTAPKITEYLGNGDYRVRGLRFHMRGKWQISLEIREADRSDTITFELTL